MDAKRFDTIARVVGSSSDRRGLFKAAAGGALGLVGLSALTDSASARRCTTYDDCPANKLCDNRKCVECKNDRNCSNGRVCLKNQCVRTCKTNPDCDRNEFCVKQVCVECKSDRDCDKGEKCNRKNKCVNQ
jgi:Cys-rich repeat protein